MQLKNEKVEAYRAKVKVSFKFEGEPELLRTSTCRTLAL
jgi:hypothetical protein